MQTSGNSDSAKIGFDLPPADCLRQLVNNKYLADVVFKVGHSGELIYAHKLIITMASEVFFAQFNGAIFAAQSKQADPVVIDDIEPAPFLQLLHYMYCKEIDITAGNLLDMLYGSRKYILKNLNVMCVEKLDQLIDETTVLRIFQQNCQYRFPTVNKICLEMICDNPLKYFRQAKFLALNMQVLQLLVSSPAMNCHMDHLEQAINRWKKNKDCRANIQFDVKPKKLLCRRLYFYDTGAYDLNVDTQFFLSAPMAFELFGIGVFVGVENDCPPMFNNSVTIRVVLNGLVIEEKVRVTDKLKVHEMMFEKQLIKGSCDVSVKITKEDCLQEHRMFHLKGMSTVGNSTFTITDSAPKTLSVVLGPKINCVAYFMINSGAGNPA